MQQDLTPETYWDRILHQPIQEDCPMRRTLELLSGKWRLYVLYVLSKASVCRFGALKRAIPGITSTMLTHALRDLETLGIVHREQFNEVPPHVEYSLTEKGLALLPVFTELAKWGDLFGPVTGPRRRGKKRPQTMQSPACAGLAICIKGCVVRSRRVGVSPGVPRKLL